MEIAMFLTAVGSVAIFSWKVWRKEDFSTRVLDKAIER